MSSKIRYISSFYYPCTKYNTQIIWYIQNTSIDSARKSKETFVKTCINQKNTLSLQPQKPRCHSSVGRAKDWKSLCPRFDSWWHHSKEKQNNVKSLFSTKIGIFYFPQTTMIVQASVTSRFLDCHATSAANLCGAKQRKKVRFTTALGGARGGANICYR